MVLMSENKRSMPFCTMFRVCTRLPAARKRFNSDLDLAAPGPRLREGGLSAPSSNELPSFSRTMSEGVTVGPPRHDFTHTDTHTPKHRQKHTPKTD